MEGIYKINLVPGDLSTEETVLQVADTLEHLAGVLDDVFARLLTRINANMNKTNELKKRIDVSQEKVAKLSGMQKAIRVFSSAKYPAAIKHDHYQSIFDLNGYKHEPKKVTLSRKAQGRPGDKEIQEKLHFYHVKVAQPKTQRPKLDLKQNLRTKTTVGELLIFDTDECPFFGPTSRAPTYKPTQAQVETKGMLEAAPSSIANRDIPKRDEDAIMYAPGMGMVPELEMPLDLPHLTGIAGDIRYSMSAEDTIAPSAVTSPLTPVDVSLAEAVADLPAVAAELPDLVFSEAAKLPDIPDAPPVGFATSALPPPPPPPPPPPSPPVDAAPAPPKEPKSDPKSAPVKAPSGDAHSNLMAAIRQAGGAGKAKLRPADDVGPDKGSTSKASGGDLMADLHARLSMRRRGISGAERAAAGGSVLHTLASVIPEPDSEVQSSEDDWE